MNHYSNCLCLVIYIINVYLCHQAVGYGIYKYKHDTVVTCIVECLFCLNKMLHI